MQRLHAILLNVGVPMLQPAFFVAAPRALAPLPRDRVPAAVLRALAGKPTEASAGRPRAAARFRWDALSAADKLELLTLFARHSEHSHGESVAACMRCCACSWR
jgi:hypothetical protein